MKKLEDELKEYVSGKQGMGYMPELIQIIKNIPDIDKYVMNLPEECVLGKKPVIIAKSGPDNIELYWNPEKSFLYLEWK